MATNKTIAFEIEILGHSKTVQSITAIQIELDKTAKARRELKKAYDEGLVSEKQYEKELTKITGQSKALQKEKQELNKELRQQQKQANLNVGSMAHLRAATAKLSKELNEHSRGVTISAKEYDKMAKTVAKNRKEIIDFDQSLNDGRSNVGRYADSLTGLIGNATGLNGIIGGLGAGIGAGLAFGAVVSAAGTAINYVQQLVTEFGTFRDKVIQLSGETGESLDNVVVKIDSISKTFGRENDEVLTATKNLAQQYSISFEEAATLIEQGFQRGADASGNFLDIISEYPAQFRAAGLTASDFVDAATANELLGFYNDKGVDAIKEFGLSVREQTKATQEAFQKAFGIEFADDFFKQINQGTLSAGEGIEVFVNKIRESNLPIKEQQTLIADVFRGAGEDAGILSEVGLQYLETITDMRNGTLELTKEQEAYLERTKELGTANYRLSAAKNELTKRLVDESGAFNVLQTEAQAFLIETLNELIDAFAPVIDAFGELFSTIGEYIDLLFDSGEASSEAANEGSILSDIFEAVASALTFVIDVFTTTLDLIIYGIKEVPILSNAFDLLRNYIQGLLTALKSLPSVFKGIIAGATQMKDNIINAFKDILLQLQILRLEAEKYNPFGDASDKIQQEINKLKKKRADLGKAGKTVGQAFVEGYNESVDNIATNKVVDKLAREAAIKKEQDKKEAAKTKAEREAAAKEAAKQAKRAAEKAAKEAEQERKRLEREAEKEAERQRKAAEKLASDLQKIQRQAIEKELQLLEDGIEKEKRLQQNRFVNDIADLKQQLIDKEDLTENEVAYNETINKLIEAKETEHRQKLSEIDQKYAEKAQSELEKTTDYKIEQLEKEATIQTTLAEQTIDNETELAAAKKKIALDVANEKLKLIQTEIEASGTATEAQIQQIRQLKTQIDGLTVAQSGNSQLVDGANNLQANINTGITTGIGDLLNIDDENAQAVQDAAIGAANTVFDAITDAKAAQIERELQQDLEYYQQRAATELQVLEEQKAAGLLTEEEYEARRMEIQNRAEVQAQRAQQRAFEQERQLKIRMAVINGITAVLNTLATVPFPANLIAAASIGVKTAFEVAQIKKAEQGMYLDKGKRHAQGGELVEVEQGEAIINRRALASRDIINLTGTPLQIADALNTYKGTGRSFLQSVGLRADTGQLPSFALGGFNGKVPATLTPRFVQEQRMMELNFEGLAAKIGQEVSKTVNDKQVFVTQKDLSQANNQAVQVKQNSKWL